MAQDLKLHFTHQLDVYLSQPFVPDNVELGIFFLKLPKLQKRRVRVVTFRKSTW